jgi:hypothetical protein
MSGGGGMKADDIVCFKVGGLVSNDLRLLFIAAGRGIPVRWYRRAMMLFMATCGPQWAQFARGPALQVL